MTSSAARLSTRLARLGWAGLVAVALLGPACAWAQPAPPAQPPCALMVKGIDGYVFVRMRSFDPSNKAVPLYPADPAEKIEAVMCERKTLVPEPTDYRVISEMRLPLAIRSGTVTVWLGADHGGLTIQIPPAVSDADQQAIKARVAELQATVDALKRAEPAAVPASPDKPVQAVPAKPPGGKAPS